MIVFKVYFKILKKQLASILIYGLVFLALTAMLTWNKGASNDSFSTRKVKIMVLNEDGSNELLDSFLNYLEQYAVFAEPNEDEEERQNALFFRKVEYILTIPAGFTKDFFGLGSMTLIKDTVPDSADSVSIDNAINNYLNIARNYIKRIPDISQAQLTTLIEASLGSQTVVRIDSGISDAVSNSNNFNNMFFNYLGYIMIACFINGVSTVMFSFTSLDIRRRFVASPLPGRKINLQLILANMLYLFGYLAAFIIAGFVLNRNRMLNANTCLTWLNAAVFAFTCLSFSYLVGITVKSKNAIQAISTAVSLSIAFISGIFIPQEYISAPVLKVASFAPGYWYVKANEIIAKMNSFDWSQFFNLIGHMGIQIGFAIAIFSIAMLVSKRKAQQE